ncbi:sugar ABC transporter permease [Paenibacillus sp. LHD-117]|uniref:carbohydrate ABC transporter permease n=1 Tax=Paenibacillus sp. LHD-117 TaxID=3071412 RepID=UPI0027E12957|nr:sugar ABC transporter permease [Paenibacillus sp. LHD-117]MDQ6422056.1 sugar ABC transporter permease [Paenibacillus sp. LHD-117]
MNRVSPWKRKLRNNVTGYLFLLPTILVLGTFLFLPVFYSLYLSGHRVSLLGEVSYNWVGIKNFVRLTGDERAWIAVKNTAEFALFVVPLQTAFAILLAVILNAKLRFKNFFRVVFFMPTVTSSAVLSLIFMWIYNSNGLLNRMLELLGLQGYNWLGDPAVAMKAIMIMNIWSTAPFFMVVFLAALQDIPDSLYESAMLDGAGAWRRFFSITLPLIKPSIFFAVVMGIIGTFQLFDQSYIFSAGSGGPNNSTLTVALLIYQYAFKNLDFGYASALAVMLAAIILIATLIQRKLFKEEKLN